LWKVVGRYTFPEQGCRGGSVRRRRGLLHSVETPVDECEKRLWVGANRRSGLGKPQVGGESSEVGLRLMSPTACGLGCGLTEVCGKPGEDEVLLRGRAGA